MGFSSPCISNWCLSCLLDTSTILGEVFSYKAAK